MFGAAAMTRGDLPESEQLRSFWPAFGECFRGFGKNKSHADLWTNFIVGFAEVAAYPNPFQDGKYFNCGWMVSAENCFRLEGVENDEDVIQQVLGNHACGTRDRVFLAVSLRRIGHLLQRQPLRAETRTMSWRKLKMPLRRLRCPLATIQAHPRFQPPAFPRYALHARNGSAAGGGVRPAFSEGCGYGTAAKASFE